MEPICCELPEYPSRFRVQGFERRRNHGPVLTLAIAEWTREGFLDWHPVRDVVTLMRLADHLSNRHALPVNADKLYGPRGRRCDVGRVAS